MHQRGKSNGPRRHLGGSDLGFPGLQVFRGSDRSTEKVKKDIADAFSGLFRINTKTLELHPDDHARVTDALAKLGHTVRTSRNQIFINERFRATFDTSTVHLTDLRTYN